MVWDRWFTFGHSLPVQIVYLMHERNSSGLKLTRPDRRRVRRCVDMRRYLSQKDVCSSVVRTAVSENEIHRESHVKGNCALNLVDILIGKCHAQGVDIGF